MDAVNIKMEEMDEPDGIVAAFGNDLLPIVEAEKLEEGEIEDTGASLSEPFRVDVSLIQQAQLRDADEVENLGLQVFNQEELEAGVLAQAERRMEEEAAVRREQNKEKSGRLKMRLKVPRGQKPRLPSPAKKQSPKVQEKSAHLSAFERYMADQQARMAKKKESLPVSGPVNGIRAASLQQKRALSDKGRRRDKPKKGRKAQNGDEEEEKDFIDDDDESDGGESVSSRTSAPRGRLKAGRTFADDAREKAYLKRMRAYRAAEAERQQQAAESGESEECEYVELSAGLRVPMRVWGELYAYQKKGVKWLWELHQQDVGGILADEMGLGKTIQIIAYLAAMQYSGLYDKSFAVNGLGPVLIICPATVLGQWVNEWHKWWPPARVAILHASGSHSGSKSSLISTMIGVNGILITTYQGVLSYQVHLIKHKWHYVILDEGHKIRNPDSQIAVACKQFRTPHRIICSGSPMQNNLRELWSLMDFVFPGKLGLLNVFLEQFSVPIIQGSRESASDLQVQTAFVCATCLKDTISPYLLRRSKADVKLSIQLPEKNEQVLFCQLTDHQRNIYEGYLKSDELMKVIHGDVQIFVGLMQLRKLCNHPDLFDGGPKIFLDARTQKPIVNSDGSSEFGFWRRSGKMIVLEALLKIWKKQGHKVLLFSQSRKMLNILEEFMKERRYKYLRMDGETPIGKRQTLIAQFNTDESVFLFLLTTKVGGLGVNLTGADRVIIFDPDWNPSTDTQARERAWRIGQQRSVTIYRLLCAGTIEEKIYHRQIFKQYLTNRVLKDPKQKRFFKHNDLYELFSLQPPDKEQLTETGASFLGEEPGEKKAEEKPKKRRNMIDGEVVQGLAKKERYEKQEDEKEDGEDKKKDAYVLGKLFKKTTIHSTVPFEEISSGDQRDHAILESEAQKVADEAMRLLRLSRNKCHTAQTGIPNWVGGAPFIPVQPALAPTSAPKQTLFQIRGGFPRSLYDGHAELFEEDVEKTEFAGKDKVHQRPQFAQDDDSESPATAGQLLSHLRRSALSLPETSPADDPDMGPQEFARFENLLTQGPDQEEDTFVTPQQMSLAEELVHFLNHKTLVPGEASTQQVLVKFKDKIPPDDSAVFRAVLRGVCEFHKKRTGPGLWVLKPAYRDYSR